MFNLSTDENLSLVSRIPFLCMYIPSLFFKCTLLLTFLLLDYLRTQLNRHTSRISKGISMVKSEKQAEHF